MSKTRKVSTEDITRIEEAITCICDYCGCYYSDEEECAECKVSELEDEINSSK